MSNNISRLLQRLWRRSTPKKLKSIESISSPTTTLINAAQYPLLFQYSSELQEKINRNPTNSDSPGSIEINFTSRQIDSVIQMIENLSNPGHEVFQNKYLLKTAFKKLGIVSFYAYVNDNTINQNSFLFFIFGDTIYPLKSDHPFTKTKFFKALKRRQNDFNLSATINLHDFHNIIILLDGKLELKKLKNKSLIDLIANCEMFDLFNEDFTKTPQIAGAITELKVITTKILNNRNILEKMDEEKRQQFSEIIKNIIPAHWHYVQQFEAPRNPSNERPLYNIFLDNLNEIVNVSISSRGIFPPQDKDNFLTLQTYNIQTGQPTLLEEISWGDIRQKIRENYGKTNITSLLWIQNDTISPDHNVILRAFSPGGSTFPFFVSFNVISKELNWIIKTDFAGTRFSLNQKTLYLYEIFTPNNISVSRYSLKTGERMEKFNVNGITSSSDVKQIAYSEKNDASIIRFANGDVFVYHSGMIHHRLYFDEIIQSGGILSISDEGDKIITYSENEGIHMRDIDGNTLSTYNPNLLNNFVPNKIKFNKTKNTIFIYQDSNFKPKQSLPSDTILSINNNNGQIKTLSLQRPEQTGDLIDVVTFDESKENIIISLTNGGVYILNIDLIINHEDDTIQVFDESMQQQ